MLIDGETGEQHHWYRVSRQLCFYLWRSFGVRNGAEGQRVIPHDPAAPRRDIGPRDIVSLIDKRVLLYVLVQGRFAAAEVRTVVLLRQ